MENQTIVGGQNPQQTGQNPINESLVTNEKPKVNRWMISIIVLLLLLLGVGRLYILNFKNQKESSQVSSPTSTPVKTEIKKLSLFYDLSALGKSGNKYFKADIDGKNTTEVVIDNQDFIYDIGTISPVANGRYLTRFDFKKFDIAPSSNPADFKTIVKAGEKESISGLTFSTDMTKLAYIITDVSSRERNWKLYTVNIDGSNRKEVNVNLKNTYLSLLTFDSQTNKLYVLASVKVDENRTREDLGVIDLAKEDYKELAEIEFNSNLTSPLLSPDFKKVYLIKSDLKQETGELDNKIVEIDLLDSSQKTLFDPPDNRISLRELRLSPNGKMFAFEYNSDVAGNRGTDIYLFDLTESKPSVLVDRTTYANLEYVGSWSPDGKYLWFTRRLVPVTEGGSKDINHFEDYVIDVNTKNVNLFHKDTEVEPIRIMGWLAE